MATSPACPSAASRSALCDIDSDFCRHSAWEVLVGRSASVGPGSFLLHHSFHRHWLRNLHWHPGLLGSGLRCLDPFRSIAIVLAVNDWAHVSLLSVNLGGWCGVGPRVGGLHRFVLRSGHRPAVRVCGNIPIRGTRRLDRLLVGSLLRLLRHRWSCHPSVGIDRRCRKCWRWCHPRRGAPD